MGTLESDRPPSVNVSLGNTNSIPILLDVALSKDMRASLIGSKQIQTKWNKITASTLEMVEIENIK